MSKEASYPTITETQFEIWIDSAPTRALLTAMQLELDELIHNGGNGSLVDSSNADMTHAMIHGCMGKQDMVKKMADIERFLDGFGLIEYPAPKEDDDANTG